MKPLLPLLMLASLAAQAQTPAKPSVLPAALVQAVKKAVDSNPEVQAKWYGFLAADNQRDIAKSGYMPQVDVSASAGTVSATPATRGSSYDTSSGKLSVNQILFDGFFTRNEVARLGSARRTRYYELLESAQTVAQDSFKAYVDVVRYRELVDAATQNFVEHQQSAQLVEERVNSGVGRRADLEQVNGRKAQAESNLLTELTNLHDVSARYLRLVGEKPLASLPMLPEPFRLGVMPVTVDELMRVGLQNSPTFLAAMENAKSLGFSRGTAQSAYMPRVDLQGYAQRGYNTSVYAGDSSVQGGAVALAYNVYRGNADKAGEKKAGFDAAGAADLQNKACRDVRQLLSLAYSDVNVLSEKLGYEDRHRLATEKTREGYRQQFNLGQRTLMDLLNTQNEFFESSRSYINARHEQASAQARTLAASGQLLSAMGVAKNDMPAVKDVADEDQVDPLTLCEGAETVVDTVDNIKAGLNLPAPQKRVGSYVVLLPDRNNVVGQITVEGKGGKQVLSEAQKGVKADGGGSAFAVSNEQLKRDFGTVMAALPRAPERFVLYFQRGKDVLTTESKALLPTIVERAAARPGLDMSVIGHTDTSGTEKVNEVLGRERATFVARQLREKGLKTDALAIESFGKKSLEVPTADNIKEQRNRRVEVILR